MLVLTVRWKIDAIADLSEILDYIEIYNPIAALKLRNIIENTAESLANMPYRFPRGRVLNTREVIVHPNYIIVYSVDDVHVDILGVLHARQEYPF